MAILINLKSAGAVMSVYIHKAIIDWILLLVGCAGLFLTVAAVVVHEDYLFEKVRRCPVDGGVNGPQDHRQGFIHKNEHNAHLREA